MPAQAANLSVLSGISAEYIANLYKEYLKNPAGVDPSWQAFFGDLRDDEASLLKEITGASWTPNHQKKPQAPFGVTTADEALKSSKPANSQGAKPAPAAAASAPAASATPQALRDSMQAILLVRAYRTLGHLAADLDPLGIKKPSNHPELDPAAYGFGAADLDRPVYIGGVMGVETASIRQLIEVLRTVYCGKVGVEYQHILSAEEKNWLQARIEPTFNRTSFTADEKKAIYKQLVSAQGLEDFLHTKYVGTKRFGLDGGESYVASVEEIMAHGVRKGVREIVIGMAHRGRLNTLTNVVGKPFTKLFAEFNGVPSVPEGIPGSGDVKYHMGYSNDRTISGESVHITLTPNPSHLEVVNPVVIGRVRAKQAQRQDTARKQVLPIIVHGDAAFAGQGLVMETLMLSELQGYKVGGAINLIINNQIGFTTNPESARSGPYSSDLAKMLACPIFHVNGDDAEAVAHVSRLAIEYRQEFGRDVVIDLICYRRNGHNEGDEPMFTQPLMYKNIKGHETVRSIYGRQLVAEQILSEADAKGQVDSFMKGLDESFEATKSYKVNKADWLEGSWSGLKAAHGDARRGETALTDKQLAELGDKLTAIPSDFNINTKIARQIDAKKEMFKAGAGFDWATGEALAFASLLGEGFNVRLSGQDVGRGTFSHRHATLKDQDTENLYRPLQHISDKQGMLEVYESPLSEAAVLGFELGYSWTDPKTLVLWEAQFGDFVNGAQVIIDQYISSAESKWLRMSGLTMLLPHGSEGQGPEHSSARPERFLQLCAEDNMQVCNLTTPANYFHALRRQQKRDFRKPLIIMTPKSLLRHKLAVSKAADFTGASTFHRFLWDDAWNSLEKPAGIKRVIMCSGKVYYDLFEEREKRGLKNIMILRLEQLYPFAQKEIAKELAQYGNAEFVWCQEEPKNQGYWSFVNPLLEDTLTDAGHKGKRFRFVGRPAAAAPATGYAKRHAEEQAQLLGEALSL